jgi:glycosyltransferase involved in cell wall biosynthesis
VRILWVKSNLLHPLDSGGKLRSYNMLKHMCREHDVTYLAYSSSAPEARERASEYCDRLVTIPREEPPERRSVAFAWEAVRNLFSNMPLSLERYDSPELRQEVADLTGEGEFDVVVADFLTTAPAVEGVSQSATVLFQHNVEAVIWDRLAESASGLLGPYYRLQARRMEDWERRLVHRFDRVVAVSEEDAASMRERYSLDDVYEVPTGVDTSYFRPLGDGDHERRSSRVLFIGSLDWLPNVDGLEWFVSEIWPRVRGSVPDAEFDVVGRRPSPELRRELESRDGISVHPDVPDVRPYLERAAVFVVPLRVGSGTRLKIYEAMASGRAVVTTRIGAEGLPLESEEHALLVEESGSSFADAVIRLLEHPEERRGLEDRGCRFVRDNFGWEQVAADFARICERAAHRPRDGTTASA